MPRSYSVGSGTDGEDAKGDTDLNSAVRYIASRSTLKGMDASNRHPCETVSFNVDVGVGAHNVVDALFLRTALAEGLTSMHSSGWVTHSSLEDPPGAVLARMAFHEGLASLVTC